ncbi:hypothetical protein [Amycolatopsis sp.]|uniref:hypothetical protein n=1 Tax=Amycolatopsis sp. TaxID=37632 RepID=UPI002B512B6C|nr:hypothetical protein [Amycolatopsis sp.]HVV10468.1 hypothetical protein [Amycolatopsis sp.]
MAVTFDGTWQIDTGKSRVWDPDQEKYIADEVGDEIITIRTEGDVQDYEVLLGVDPTVRMGYTTRFDDREWARYEVREVIGRGDEAAMAGFRQRTMSNARFTVGTSYGLVRSVYVDERTHYRICKDEESGEAQYVMLRRLAEDGQSYGAYVLRANGLLGRERHFVRLEK